MNAQERTEAWEKARTLRIEAERIERAANESYYEEARAKNEAIKNKNH